MKCLIIAFHRTCCTFYNKKWKKALILDMCQDKYTLKTKMEEINMFIIEAQCLTVVS